MKYPKLVINSIYPSVFAGLFMVINSTGAAEVKLYNTPPSADEVRQALFPESADAPQQRKTRAIHMLPSASEVQPSSAAPPAAAPPTARQQAAAPAPVSSTPASAASSPGIIAVQLQFPYKSAEITPDQTAFLDPIGEGMSGDKTGKSQIVIEGHTDGAGSDSYNRALSYQRAQAAKQYLTSKYGIEPNRIIAVGKGKSELLVKDNPLDERNRRIQFRRK